MKALFRYIILFVVFSAGFLTYSQDAISTDTTLSHTELSVSEDDSDDDDPADTSVLRQMNEAEWDNIQKDKSFVYSHEKIKPEKTKEPTFNINFLTSGFFKAVIYVIVALLLIVVMYSLFSNGALNLFTLKRKKQEEVKASYEQVDLFTDWAKALQDSLNEKNYRLSVRILYLETLQKLNSQKLIVFEEQKTNWDYVFQLSKTSHATSFTTLTKYFDYVWYGNFFIGINEYNSIENLFRKFQEDIQ